MNFLKVIVFVLLVNSNCYSQNTSDSLNIYFYENDAQVDVVRLIEVNKNLDLKKVIILDRDIVLKANLDFINNLYFIETKHHLVNFPEINYLEKVNDFEIYYYTKKKENKFIKLYGDDFYQAGKENYYFSFGLEEIMLISVDKSKIRKNRRIIKSAKALN